ncbi:chemotaxis protein CheW [Luteimonas sp. SX5]|uniref:Chemotaxis protein CheW n=1 Tax=Luteimonas galliterrae TaxID=2940486 RepID=A0ABT0MHY9_9GAMM|nr:chemotaxis protein CheW [Luteimonas galliterrae]MCL1634484.1 chemotaxis protein CheW [Luteimonas galliterrae]
MASTTNDIRGVLIQVAGARLLLPNATIAEVLSYAEPERVENAPEWLLGRIRWRGWRLPLIAFARMAGISDESAALGNKVLVLKALGGDPKMPYFALLTQGFPRLVTVARDELIADAVGGDLPPGVQARVLLREDPALLPDLSAVESRIGEALQAA